MMPRGAPTRAIAIRIPETLAQIGGKIAEEEGTTLIEIVKRVTLAYLRNPPPHRLPIPGKRLFPRDDDEWTLKQLRQEEERLARLIGQFSDWIADSHEKRDHLLELIARYERDACVSATQRDEGDEQWQQRASD